MIDISNIKNKTNVINSVFTGQYTKTHFFIYPCLGLEDAHNDFKIRSSKRYLNSFIGHFQKPSLGPNKLYVLYKLKTENYSVNNYDLNFVKELSEFHNFLFSYSLGKMEEDENYELLMVVFKIPEIFLADINFIKRGLFSKTSDNYKNHCLKYYEKHNPNLYNSIAQILHRSKNLKTEIEKMLNVKLENDAELFDRFDLNFEKYK